MKTRMDHRNPLLILIGVCVLSWQCVYGYVQFTGFGLNSCRRLTYHPSQQVECRVSRLAHLISTRNALCTLRASATQLPETFNVSTIAGIQKVISAMPTVDPDQGSATMMKILSTVSNISGHGSVESIRQIWDIVGNLESAGCKPNKMAVSHFMESCVKLAAAGKASTADGLRILEWGRNKGIRPDTVLYSLQMDVIAKSVEKESSALQMGFDLLDMMRSDNVTANVITYTSLLDVCAKAIAASTAEPAQLHNVLSAMQGAHVQPNEKTLTAQLAAYAAAAGRGYPLLDEARDALEEMIRGPQSPDGQGWPLTAPYNALLDVYAKSAGYGLVSWDDCLGVVDLMKAREVPRDAITYHTLLEGGRRLAGLGNVSVADGWAVISAMEEDGVVPNEDCFHSLISLCAKAASLGNATLADAREVREEMRRRGLRVTTATYATEMDVVAKLAGRKEAGMKEGMLLLQEMRREGVAPDTCVFNVLMDVSSKAAAHGLAGPEDGLGVLTWMGSFKARPDSFTFNSMLDLCAKAARNGKARLRHGEEVLRRMEAAGVAHDSYTLTNFIQLARVDGSVDALREARRLFMASPPALRNNRVYAVMIAALARADMLAEARGLLEEAAAHGVRANSYMYNAAMGACETAAQVLELHARMCADGVPEDDVTHKLVGRARHGWAPTRKPTTPNDPLRKPRDRTLLDGIKNL